jgi:hypothetical protein
MIKGEVVHTRHIALLASLLVAWEKKQFVSINRVIDIMHLWSFERPPQQTPITVWVSAKVQ